MNAAGFPDYVLNGLIPFNLGEADENGCFWYMDGEMIGWDSPDGRVTMLTKIGNDANADGEYPADLHYRGRTLTFTLYASCPSETARENARLLLARATDLIYTTGTLIVNEEVPKFINVSRSGNNNQGKLVMTDSGLSGPVVSTPDFPTCPVDSSGVLYVLKADIELYSPDPRKYMVAHSENPFESGACVLNNPGNTFDQNCVITILATGGGTGPLTITNSATGKVMRLKVPTLPAGAPTLSPIPSELIIDLYNQTITDAGGNSYYYLRDLTTPWPQLVPGAQTIELNGDLPGSVDYYPAWI